MSVNNNRSYHSRYYQDGQGSQTSSHSSSTRTRSSVRGGGGTRQRHYGEPRRGNYHVVHQSSSTSPSTPSSASHILRMQNYSLPSPSLRMGEGSLHMFSTSQRWIMISQRCFVRLSFLVKKSLLSESL